MQVIASGQAGLFAIRTPKGFSLERIDTGETLEASPRELSYFLAGCNDVKQLEVATAAQARKTAETEWAADRGVRLFALLLDAERNRASVSEVGEALDELLHVAGVKEKIEKQIFSDPFLEKINDELLDWLVDAPLSQDLMSAFIANQDVIMRVRSAFYSISDDLFVTSGGRAAFLEEAIERGSFRLLVLAAKDQKGVEGAVFQLYQDLRDIDNYRAIVSQWTKGFGRTKFNLPKVREQLEVNYERNETTFASNREAFLSAIHQQNAIVDRIRNGDFDAARKFARDLVESQRRTSSPEHIAKSLTNLSHKAKQLEVLDLALDWSFEAVSVKSDDPMAHAQHADILLRVGRFVEAQNSFDLAQSFGRAGFAASGKARILRHQGQYEAALDLYQDALNTYAYDDIDNQHIRAAIAECYRDLDRLEEALHAYDDALTDFPYSPVLLSGRAATLVSMGRFAEAHESYKSAIELDDDNLVPWAGMASLYRKAGQIDRAEREFRKIIIEYPFSIHARGGLVGLLRETGRFDEAVGQAKELAELLPGSADPLWILADAQIDAGLYPEAEVTLKSALEDHRHVGGLRAGLARIKKAKGEYAAALALYDEAAQDFPSNSRLQVNKADMLRRLGKVDEALRIYHSELERRPNNLAIINAIASILIFTKRFDEAQFYLDVDQPVTADEWRNFALHGMLESARGDDHLAQERFQWGIARCPFSRENRMLSAGLARIHLKAGRVADALDASENCNDGVTVLLKLHAVSLQPDKGPARALYETLQNTNLPEPYHELRDEIVRQNNVVAFPARHSRDWVLYREQDALLLEAA